MREEYEQIFRLRRVEKKMELREVVSLDEIVSEVAGSKLKFESADAPIDLVKRRKRFSATTDRDMKTIHPQISRRSSRSFLF